MFILLFRIQYSLISLTEVSSAVERRYACWGSAGPPVVSAQCPRGTLIGVTKAGLKVDI